MTNDELLKLLGTILKQLREDKDISQERLAQLSGVHRNYIGRMERGEQNASIIIWYRVCESLGKSLSDLGRMLRK